MPVAQAPGMGLNAFFAYTVVLAMGYTYSQTLVVVFISGVLYHRVYAVYVLHCKWYCAGTDNPLPDTSVHGKSP